MLKKAWQETGLTHCFAYLSVFFMLLKWRIIWLLIFMIGTKKGDSEKACVYATAKFWYRERRWAWFPRSAELCVLVSRKCARRSKRSKSAVATLDQVVLKSKKAQEAGSDTAGRWTSGSENSVGLCTREFCNQCLLCADRTANFSGRGKGRFATGSRCTSNKAAQCCFVH